MTVKFLADVDAERDVLVAGYGYAWRGGGETYVTIEKSGEAVNIDVKDVPALLVAIDKAVVKANSMHAKSLEKVKALKPITVK